jgi:outer membrane receptor protein involved in Fe transport
VPDGVDTRARTTNNPVDFTQLSNWKFDGTLAKSGETSSKNAIGLFKVDVRRELDFIPWLGSNTLAFKVGGRRDIEKTEKWGRGTGYREILKPGASYLVADILDADYLGQSPGYGFGPQQWASSYKLWQLNQEKSIFFEPTDGADAIENWNSYVNQQKKLTETTDAAYALLEGRFFKNRLTFIGGARQENKEREGYGPYTDSKWNYIKNPNGTLYVDAANTAGVLISQANSPLFAQDAAGAALRQSLTAAGIKYPTTPILSGTLAARQLQLIPNKYVHQKIEGDPSYSFSVSFDLTKKIVLKAAWSRSFGLPKLEDTTQGILSGNNSFTINENIPVPSDGTKGTISVANPGLMPRISNNWDFQVSYYTDNGGKISVSYYTKTVTNDIITLGTYSGTPTFDEVLPALGLDPDEYDNWRLNTSSNSSNKQKTDGYEIEVTQDFRFFGNWGKHFQAFATYSHKSLGDPPVVLPYTIPSPTGVPITINPTQGTIKMSANEFAGAGLQFSNKRFSAAVRATYRNQNEKERTSLGNNNYLRKFEPEETRVDLNATYRITDKYSFFVSVRDAFNATREEETKDDLAIYPDYAQITDQREFGVSVYMGVSGRF